MPVHLFDPDEKLGLAEYTTIALMRGTKDAYIRRNL